MTNGGYRIYISYIGGLAGAKARCLPNGSLWLLFAVPVIRSSTHCKLYITMSPDISSSFSGIANFFLRSNRFIAKVTSETLRLLLLCGNDTLSTCTKVIILWVHVRLWHETYRQWETFGGGGGGNFISFAVWVQPTKVFFMKILGIPHLCCYAPYIYMYTIGLAFCKSFLCKLLTSNSYSTKKVSSLKIFPLYSIQCYTARVSSRNFSLRWKEVGVTASRTTYSTPYYD